MLLFKKLLEGKEKREVIHIIEILLLQDILQSRMMGQLYLYHPWNAISEIVTISLVASGGRFCFLNSHHHWVLFISRNFSIMWWYFQVTYFSIEYVYTSSHIYWLYFICFSQATCNIILSSLSLMKWHIHIFRNWLYFVRITSCLLFLCRYILALLMLGLIILCAQIHCILPLWYVMYFETPTYNLFSFVISYFPHWVICYSIVYFCFVYI